MPTKVTDPALLQQLNGAPSKKVMDPAVLQQLNAAPMGTGEDMARSAATGVRQGVEGMGGMFGDAANLQGAVASWLAGKMGAGEDTQATVQKWGSRLSPFAMMPSTEQIATNITDPLVKKAGAEGVLAHAPETVTGEYARTIGQFAPNALAPGGLVRRAAQVLIPAVTSETAGQATKGTAAEPYARAAGGLAGGLATMGRGAGVPKASPAATTEELGAEANSLFKQSKQLGVVAKPKAMNDLFNKVQTKMQDFGLDADLQPGASIVVKRLEQSRGKPLSLQEVHNLLKKASGVAREADKPSDRAAAGIVVKQLHEFLDDPANFNANSQQGRDLLQHGIETSKRKIKSGIIDDVIEKAKNQATGFENGLVIHFRALANNKALMRSFSRAEQDMIRSIVRRPSMHGMLRAIGMLSPTSTFGGITTGMGLASGVVPGLITAGVGSAARAGAGALTKAKVSTLQNAVASGIPSVPAEPFDLNALIRLLSTAKLSEDSAATNAPVRKPDYAQP